MKKIIAFVLFTALFSVSFAQVRRSGTGTTSSTAGGDTLQANANKGTEDAGQRRKEMMRQLNLTKQQKGQLKEMQQSAKEKVAEIKNDDKLSEDDKKAKLRALRKEQQSNVQSVLNDEQKAKLKQMQSEKGKKDIPVTEK